MIGALLRRVVLAVPLIWAVFTLTFLLLELAPGDSASSLLDPELSAAEVANTRARWGLDEPILRRYLAHLAGLARGDLGQSLLLDRPVRDLLVEALPNTLQLSIFALVFGQGLGIVLGGWQAARHQTPGDHLVSFTTLVVYSLPGFWLALALQLLFCLTWNVLPSSGMTDPVLYDTLSWPARLGDRLQHLILPGLVLTAGTAAGDARFMRATMLEVLDQDYMRTARAKGLSERAVLWRHGLRNAIAPMFTLMGMNLPAAFSGAVIVEWVFGWPGMGRLMVTAIQAQDTPVVLGCFSLLTVCVVIGNLLGDLACAWADPRVRFA